MIDVGNGEIAKRIKQGLCPRCFTQLVSKPDGHKCVYCGFEITNAKSGKKVEKSVDPNK